MKKYIKLGLFPLVSLLTLALFMTILNLFEISLNKVILTILIIIIMFISGFILGKNIKDKGYLKGLLYGAAISLIMYILSIILLSEHSLYNIVYYLITTCSVTIGTMLGIQNSHK